jgi:hypothetical protein
MLTFAESCFSYRFSVPDDPRNHYTTTEDKNQNFKWKEYENTFPDDQTIFSPNTI